MCGRFTLVTDAAALAEAFGLDEVPTLTPRYNVAPTQAIAAVRPHEGRRQLSMLGWGLVPSWSKDPGQGPRPVNARSETLIEKPTFKSLLTSRRCLVLADGFYEWKHDGARKMPMHFRMQDAGPFAIAALFDRWVAPDGVALETCVLLTVGPNELVAPVHDRMPAILAPEACDRWLDPTLCVPDALTLLRPFAAEAMAAVAVGPRVNSVRHDDPACLQPAEPPPPERQMSLFDF